MAEKSGIEKIKEIMSDPTRIRNICTSAHIHHGKCVSGSTKLVLTNGDIITAKELFEKSKAIGSKFKETSEELIYDVYRNNIEIFSLNKQTGKIEKKPVELAWKLQNDILFKVTLRNGFEAATTPEHKYVVLEDGDFKDKEAKDIKIGDRVVCARKLAKYFVKDCKFTEDEINPVAEINSNSGVLQLKLSQKLLTGDIAYVKVTNIKQINEEVVFDFTIPDNHNFVAEGIVIHNTAMTDNLLAASGYMSKKAAGDLEKGMATWQHKDEQERLLTVDAANVSMVHDYEKKTYLINLIDTPGHVDFGGNVTRAMRAIDGTVVLICAVEGIMPQTETVVRQALRERVKPVLFINKVDRLINELKFTTEQMQERFTKIILDFNGLIERYAEPEFKQEWKVNILDGSVIFGSARENWALSIPFMKKRNVTFKDIYKLYSGEMSEDERQEWTWINAPLFEAVLDMVIKHLPDPIEAQKYRLPHIWKGDYESTLGKALLNCDPNGPPAFVITRITIDPKFGREISAGRLFSGTLKDNTKVYLNNAKQYQTISQVFMYNGIKPEQIGEAKAGNVIALGGVSGYAGETITLEPEQTFEELRHIFEPVITKSIEPAKASDLPKLVEVLRKVAKEDPSIKIDINEETGENLMHGMGELHLEIIENRIKSEKGLAIKTSEPIVVYREAIQKKSQECEGKSPNKHNKFYIKVEPLDDVVYNSIKNGDIPEGKIKKKDTEFWRRLVALGIDVKEARGYRGIYRGNALIDKTRGIVHIGEVIEMVMEAFEQVMKEGPLAREPGFKIKVMLMDCKLHEDAIHRGPAQVLPAVRSSIKQAMLDASAIIYEPVQILQIEAPLSYLGDLNKLIQNKRGQMLDMQQEGDRVVVKAKLPVAEMFGLSSDLRSATSGHGSQYLVDQSYEKLPREMQQKVVNLIRTRKGLKVDEDLMMEEHSGD